jgi:hypothetical protein
MEIQGQPGELRAVIHITRKATGKVETYELIGHSDPEKLAEIMAERAKVHDAPAPDEAGNQPEEQ